MSWNKLGRWGERSTNIWLPDSVTGSLINRLTKYSGFQDACVRFSFPVLLFKNKFLIKIGLSYELSTSVTGCSIRIYRAMTMSLFSMYMMASGY